MSKNIITIVCNCLLFSCSNHKTTEFEADRTITLNNNAIYDISRFGILYPLSIDLSNNELLILDDNNTKLLKVINLNGEFINSCANIGRGPNEFNQITSIDYENNIIGVYDQGFKCYTNIYADNTFKREWENDLELDMAREIWDSMFICSAVHDSTALYLLNYNGDIVDRNEMFPPRPNSIPLISHSMACSGYLSTYEHSPFFVRSVVYDGGLDVFKIENNKIIHKWRFSNFDMDYDIIKEYDNVPKPNDRTRKGYISISMGKDNIFGLFSGSNIIGENLSSSNEIHVFDYEGKHISKIILDKFVKCIAVNKEQSKLVTIQIDDKEGVFILIYEI